MDLFKQSLQSSTDDEIQLKSEDVDDPKAIAADLTIIDEDGSMSDDQTVDSLANAQAILDADDEQCQWKTESGVTYRVYQVNQDDQEGESVASDFQSSSGQPLVLTSGLVTNHFYVVDNTEPITTQTARSLAPRSNNQTRVVSSGGKVRRDDRRRATHNEVERRRRDKINNWIMKLSKIIPECSSIENNKSVQSKGCILAKACDYITELSGSNQKLAECLKENERLATHIEYLQTVNDKLKMENALLRQRHGVELRRSQES